MTRHLGGNTLPIGAADEGAAPTRGAHRLIVTVTKADLEQLKVLGYLDPDRRGDRADECEAIEAFLADSLTTCPGFGAQRPSLP